MEGLTKKAMKLTVNSLTHMNCEVFEVMKVNDSGRFHGGRGQDCEWPEVEKKSRLIMYYDLVCYYLDLEIKRIVYSVFVFIVVRKTGELS